MAFCSHPGTGNHKVNIYTKKVKHEMYLQAKLNCLFKLIYLFIYSF